MSDNMSMDKNADDNTISQPEEQNITSLPLPLAIQPSAQESVNSEEQINENVTDIDEQISEKADHIQIAQRDPATAAKSFLIEAKIDTNAEAALPYGTSGEILSAEEAHDRIAKMSRRSFMWAGVSLAATFAGWKWFVSNPLKTGALLPLRRSFEFDEKVARALFSSARLSPTFPKTLAREPRPNGMLGMRDNEENVLDIDEDKWQIHVAGVYGKTGQLALTLADIKALPRMDMVTEHKCVEGWSTIVHWTGARFVDFAAKYLPQTTDGSVPDVLNTPEKLVRYVSMTTPDGDEYKESYYIGLDMESALHTQTLLCYEMNGEPLTPEHGAPLRLAIPLKYGIKSIKRIGKIAYTDVQPADYWAEQGYDWYSGL